MLLHGELPGNLRSSKVHAGKRFHQRSTARYILPYRSLPCPPRLGSCWFADSVWPVLTSRIEAHGAVLVPNMGDLADLAWRVRMDVIRPPTVIPAVCVCGAACRRVDALAAGGWVAPDSCSRPPVTHPWPRTAARGCGADESA